MKQREKGSLRAGLKRSRLAYLFLLPLLVLIAVFLYYPALRGVVNSFFDLDILGTSRFVGLANFRELFSDEIFLNSIPAMLKLMLPRLVISVVVPLVMAELIFYLHSSRLQYAFRVLCLLPMVAPGVVNTLIWKTIYDPSSGLAVILARALGFVGPNANVDWLGDKALAIPSIIFMGFPWIGGTAVLIYMSGLMNVAGDLKEASLLDGAGTLRRIFSIDLPLIMGQIRYFLVFGIIGGLQDYGVQIILTKGGPGYETYVPGYYMFKQAFTYNRMGYASSIGTLLFVVIFALTMLVQRLTRSKDGDAQ